MSESSFFFLRFNFIFMFLTVLGLCCCMQASVVVVHGLSCSAACGIFPDQGADPCPLHWQVDSYPLHHQGSPRVILCNMGIFSFSLEVYN